MDPGLVYALIALAAAAVAAGLAAAMLRQMRRLRDDSASLRAARWTPCCAARASSPAGSTSSPPMARRARGHSGQEPARRPRAEFGPHRGVARRAARAPQGHRRGAEEHHRALGPGGRAAGHPLQQAGPRGVRQRAAARTSCKARCPPSAFQFEATLSNGRRADCLIKLPMPPGPIAVDAKFPLESFEALRAAPDEPRRKPGGERLSPRHPQARQGHRRALHRPRGDRRIGAHVPAFGGDLCRAARQFHRAGAAIVPGAGVDRVADHPHGDAEHGARGAAGRQHAQAGRGDPTRGPHDAEGRRSPRREGRETAGAIFRQAGEDVDQIS